MDCVEMLRRIKNKDKDAYVELMKKYGGGLYTRLLKKLGSREAADEVFRETMLDFYKQLSREDSSDAVESLLIAQAERICTEKTRQRHIVKPRRIEKKEAEQPEAENIRNLQENSRVSAAPAYQAPPAVQNRTSPEPVYKSAGSCAAPVYPVCCQPAQAANVCSRNYPQMTEPYMRGNTAPAYIPQPCPPPAPVQQGMQHYPPEQPEKHGIGVLGGIGIAVLVLVILYCIWMLLGVLMRMGLIQCPDLGYSWFNAHIASIF